MIFFGTKLYQGHITKDNISMTHQRHWCIMVDSLQAFKITVMDQNLF